MTHTERRQQWRARIEAYKASGLSATGKEDIALNDFLAVKVGPAVIEVREGFNEELLLHVVKVLNALC